MCLFDWAVMLSGDLHDCHTFQSYVLQNLTALAVSDRIGLQGCHQLLTAVTAACRPAGRVACCASVMSEP